jgi:hypothetical protein
VLLKSMYFLPGSNWPENSRRQHVNFGEVFERLSVDIGLRHFFVSRHFIVGYQFLCSGWAAPSGLCCSSLARLEGE